MASEKILTSVNERVGLITIDRPEVLNALDIPTLQELSEKFSELEDDDSVHVIVITEA